ncbi:hypothetical protein Tco_0328811 [Tanacetum coccineum]
MNMVVYQMDVKTAFLNGNCGNSFYNSQFVREGKELLLVQVYVDDIIFAASTPKLCKYGMKSSDPVDTPMVEKSKLDEDPQGKAVDPTHYRGMVGTLMYLTASRPDLTFVVCMYARGLWYPKDSSIALTAYADADHTGCQDTRRSTSETLSGCCAQVIWMRAQLIDYGLGFNKILIFHFIKEQVENEVVELYLVNTEYQLADIFTKPLCRERIKVLINKLGMRSFAPETLKQLANEVEE